MVTATPWTHAFATRISVAHCGDSGGAASRPLARFFRGWGSFGKDDDSGVSSHRTHEGTRAGQSINRVEFVTIRFNLLASPEAVS
ncbi:MAG: hypothetical protein COB10_10795 [Planctomycetota bacterium]|nr:MAG: hypothetical protein COB10_10795 [Planctomycetota bacterium]